MVLGRIDEYDSHTDSLVYVDDLPVGHESPLLARDKDPKESVFWKSARGVHVASLTADFSDSSHDAHCARGFDKFRDGEEGISRYRALSAV